MALHKKTVAIGAAVALPALASVVFVASNAFDSAKADIGPIPLPPIPLLGADGGATPTTAPSPSASASPTTSTSPSPSPSVSVSPSPSTSPSPAPYPRPKLTQSNKDQQITFTVKTDPRFQGYTVWFYRRSGMTGKVAPLGTAQVDSIGLAFRFLKVRPNQIIRAYAKIPGSAPPAPDAYTNDVAVKVP